MPPSAPRLLRLGAAVALAAAAAGCGGAFDPRAEADVYFTLWGYLDASADTQWVRVSPVRETVDPAAGPLDADVVLERVATGEGTALRDSVFIYENGLAAHNYWTTAPVEPGETYRLRVRRSDGAETGATVRVPPAYPAPTLGDGRCQCPATVTVSGVERLVDVAEFW